MDQSMIIFFAVIVIFGALLLAIISLSRKGKRYLNQEYYRTEWLKVENNLTRDNVSSHQISVLNADKLVDHALKRRGFGGQTMGDRLKLAKKTLTNTNSVWAAHKLRNKIAHETNFSISYDEARHSLNGFKQALKDLGAI